MRLFLKIFFKIFPFLRPKIKSISIDDIKGLSKTKITDKEIFSMDRGYDIYGNFHEDFNQDSYTATIPELYVYTLKNGMVENGLEEIYTSKKQVIKEYTTQEINPRIGEFFPTNPVKKIRGSLAYFNLSGLENFYGHFWCEYISQIYLLWKSGIKADYYIFTQELPFQKEFVSLICKIFNIQQTKLITLPKGTIVKPDTLIFTSLINSKKKILLKNRTFFNKVYMPSFVKDVYRLLAESIPANNGYGEKIYISREKMDVRNSTNEKEVQDIVTKKGFVVIHPEDFSVAEQIAIFKNTKYLIATSGSGISSFFVTQKQNAKILLFFPYYFPDTHYKILSSICNISYDYIRCNSSTVVIEGEPREDDLTVDLEGLKIFLDSIK